MRWNSGRSRAVAPDASPERFSDSPLFLYAQFSGPQPGRIAAHYSAEVADVPEPGV
jgi:hypothetical protein